MAAPLVHSQTHSSDYFEEEDSEFLNALQTAVLPGDIPLAPPAQDEDGSDEDSELEPPPATQPSLKRHRLTSMEKRDAPPEIQLVQEDETYAPLQFGEFGKYMDRKRAKLQIQNAQIAAVEDGEGDRAIFKGLAIYINGYTQPSVQDLRKLIVEHGGIFHPYLDKKSLVTHIITCSLTAAKIREFQYRKVVRPEWLVESVKAGVLLPWKDFIFTTNSRLEGPQGTKPNQKTLLNSNFSSSTITPPRRILPERSGVPDSGSKTNQVASLLQVAPRSVDVPVPPIQTENPINGHEPQNGLNTTREIPKYAADVSNPFAQRAMADPNWRNAHTAVAPDFIEGYYKNSRLHHLSTWKAELKNLVQEAQERAEATSSLDGGIVSVGKVASEAGLNEHGVSMRGAELVTKSPTKNRDKGKGKAKALDGDQERVIMHCDFDCFFVSAGLISRPHLREKPVVVCHSQGAQGGAASTSEIASASYEARSFGIKNGMSLQQARKLCPNVVTIPYEFEQYKKLSLQFYTILMSHADDLQAVSVDEALIEVTNTVVQLKEWASQDSSIDPVKDYAETIRAQVRKATGCEVSVGISYNILLSRLATRRAKPAGSFHLTASEVPEFLAPLDIADLHGFGRSARDKAKDKLGATTLGELATKSKSVLCEVLGKSNGETLFNAIRGIDEKKLESDKPRKSVSCEINYGIRFENNDQAETFIYQVAAEVAKRLRDVNMIGKSITLKIMKRDPTAPVEPPKFLGHGACDLFNKQTPLIGPGGRATGDEKVIGEHAWRLLKSFKFDPKELRGVGMQIQKLEPSTSSATLYPGQGILPFRRAESSAMAAQQQPVPDIYIDPPSSYGHGTTDVATTSNVPVSLDLPSFSQVDMNVFDALPADLRKELEDEYKRRSASPFPANVPGPANVPPAVAAPPKRPSVPPPVFQGNAPMRGRNNNNFRGVARQFGARGRPKIPAQNNLLFQMKLKMAQKKAMATVKISEAELRDFDIDPEVFFLLPVKVQREQLIRARLIKKTGRIPTPPERKVLKPRKYVLPASYKVYRAPAPQAKFKPPPFLRQRGKEKGEKLYFTEMDDIQNVIEKWVDGYRHWAPKEKDIEFFAKYLEESVDGVRSTDVEIEKAVGVLKWWMILLRRFWGGSELVEDDPSASPGDPVGEAWWKAFRQVKGRMDVVARKKFGGRLSLK